MGGGSQQVRRLSSQQLKQYTPTPCGPAQERKNTDLKPENKRQVDITFQPLHIYQSQDPAVCDPANSYIIWSHVSYIHFSDWGLLSPRKKNMAVWSAFVLTLTEGKSKAKTPREEVRPLHRQAPKDHVTEGNHFLYCSRHTTDLQYGFLATGAFNWSPLHPHSTINSTGK